MDIEARVDQILIIVLQLPGVVNFKACKIGIRGVF